MFYVLDFETHTFKSCNSMLDVLCYCKSLSDIGKDMDNLEIINGFLDDSRLTYQEVYDLYNQGGM